MSWREAWVVDCSTCDYSGIYFKKSPSVIKNIILSFSKREVQEAAKDNGWVADKDRWFCPECVRKGKK